MVILNGFVRLPETRKFPGWLRVWAEPFTVTAGKGRKGIYSLGAGRVGWIPCVFDGNLRMEGQTAIPLKLRLDECHWEADRLRWEWWETGSGHRVSTLKVGPVNWCPLSMCSWGFYANLRALPLSLSILNCWSGIWHRLIEKQLLTRHYLPHYKRIWTSAFFLIFFPEKAYYPGRRGWRGPQDVLVARAVSGRAWDDQGVSWPRSNLQADPR